ncbi:ARL14 effector protein-like [Clonorchis sinensis]|uniref:ARL14 effector protein-like n=1 Tax=Clonorchis sinensis TaxID=79923 RepID=A0A419PK39_CLOSI|nr:ARL14 effector protein-like [Clonorchis sinensis]
MPSDPSVNQKDRHVQKARKSTAPSTCGSSGSTGSGENRELDRLKFSNPGKAMKDLQFPWRESNLTRNFRKQLASRHHRKDRNSSPPLYDSRGRKLGSLVDTCDCLREDCPGCHLPCRRCHSTFCGPVCRIYRTFTFQELHTSSDPEVAVAGCTGFGIALRHRAEGSLLDWIPVDSRLCENVWWFGQVLSASIRCLQQRVLFSVPSSEWDKQMGGQSLTMSANMKILSGLCGSPSGVGSMKSPCAS